VYHPNIRHHDKVFEQYADELNLVKTGGSDCHGNINGNEPAMGNPVPYSILEQLKNLKNNP